MSTRILVVEDEAIIAADLADRLSGMGYQVVGTVPSGEAAIETVAQGRPDLVLMDILLAGELDGVATADHLWERFQLPVVFLTAHGDPATVRRTRRAESFGYVVKPFEERTLQATIELALYRFEIFSRTRNMERWLSTTLESIGDGVVAADLDGRITFVNTVAQHITGWECAEAIGALTEEVLPLVHSVTHAPLPDAGRRAIATGSIVHLGDDVSLRRRSGELVPIDDSAAPIRAADGKVIGVVLVFRDAADRRRAEQERARLEQRLLEAQRLRSLGMLAGGIAHDFNNLLTVIRGNVGLCQATLATDAPGQVHLAAADAAAMVAAQMCQQMLAFAGKGKVQSERVDLNAIVTGTAQLLGSAFTTTARLHLALASHLPPVTADASQLRQVVMNLVLNASEALEGRRGSVRIRTATATLSAAELGAMTFSDDAAPGEFAVLDVQDDGCGMAAETRARVFDPFFTTKFTGRGLGLAAVAGIVRGHRGAIDVASELGAGSTFRVALPIAADARAASDAPRRDLPVVGDAPWPGVALVVDDDEPVRGVLQAMLCGAGMTVDAVSSGATAVELVQAAPARYRFVLLDVTMPDPDGFATLRAIRALGARVPVLMISGCMPSGFDAVAASVGGPVAFLAKPFAQGDLLLALRQLLQPA